MSIPYTSADFTTPRATGASWIEYPFIEDGDTATKIYHLICEVNKDDYASVALDTTMANASNADVLELPFTADAAAYHVGDFNHQVIDGALLRFDRQFTSIPSDRDDVFTGTRAYSYPGIFATTDAGTERTVTAYSHSGTSTQICTLTVTNTLSIGDLFYLEITTSTTVVTGYFVAITGTTGSVVKFKLLTLGGVFDSGTLTELVIQPRGQDAVETGSTSDFTYYLPGVTAGITDATDVTETAVFKAYNPATGASVLTLGQSTVPSFVEYAEMVSDGDYIVVASNVKRWRGNIIEREDIKVRAL